MISNVEELLCFAAVCKAGSITRAAELLQCSKANVSRKITQLEKRMGVKLFQRTTRAIHLTEAGNRFKHRAIKIYDEIKQLDKSTKEESGNLSGKFKITAPVSLSTFLIAPLILDLKTSFPEIEFELVVTNENLNLIESEVDLAIRTGSVIDESLVAKKLAESHECFFTSSKNLDHYEQVNMAQLAHLPLLLPNSNTEDNSFPVLENGEPTSLFPTHSTRVSEYEVSLNMLFNSEYIAWLPRYCRGIQRNGETISPILTDLTGPPWSIFMIFPFQAPIPHKLKTVMDAIEENISRHF